MLEPNLDLEEDPNVLGIRFDLIENVALIENVETQTESVCFFLKLSTVLILTF